MDEVLRIDLFDIPLQWGRDGEVAEMRPSAARRCWPCCGFNGAATVKSRKFAQAALPADGAHRFNGAATVKSRKLEKIEAAVGGLRLLQWGRDGEVAEISIWRQI